MDGISVFVPVYNCASILKNSILLIHQELSILTKKFEIIIVDDASTDDTLIVASSFKKENIFVTRFSNGPSRRENLSVAMRSANFPIVLFTDVDLAVDVAYIKNLLLEINNGASIAIGSRHKGIKPKRTLFRKIVSQGYNMFMRNYFWSSISDHQCGFKAFKKEALTQLLDSMGYDDTFQRGWFWDAELLIRAQKKGFKISEVPVEWHFGSKSTFKISREIKMIPYVLKLRFRI